MVSIVSTNNRDYNTFFRDVIEIMDKHYTSVPKILVVGIPEGEGEDVHLSITGMDSSDMFQVAAMIQHEATREMIAEEVAEMMDEPFSEDDEYE